MTEENERNKVVLVLKYYLRTYCQHKSGYNSVPPIAGSGRGISQKNSLVARSDL